MREFDMVAKTFKGLETILAKELISLGADNVQIERRAVKFSGTKELLYRANMHLRTATRILKPIYEFNAINSDEVYEHLRQLEWSKYMAVTDTFAVNSTVYSEKFNHSQFITYRVKDAIVDWFRENYNKRPSVDMNAPDLSVHLHIANQKCTISLDSTGASLHKRGYRTEQTLAPINEALAAGMLLMAGWDGKTDFFDPMCGSGTLLIEAGLIALNIPPGIFRNEFAFERWADFEEELFEEIYNDDSKEREFKHKIYGSDISIVALRKAQQNIANAGLTKYIETTLSSVEKSEFPKGECLMVTNPPYGERITSEDNLALYATLGRRLKHDFTGNNAWVISSEQIYISKIGLKPSTSIKLLNGKLECLFNEYRLFSGKRKSHLANS